ncbi:MAG: exodeoxyribonuclease VII large subunit [Acidobacteriota bacterium]
MKKTRQTKTSLLQSLFDVEEVRKPLSVSELNAQVRLHLEREFASVWVEGEIVNFAAARSGHWYFNLNDGSSQLRAACYKGSNYRIRFKPFDGLQVRVRGRLTLYEPRGEYQILVDSLEPVGEGALRVAFEQIKAKLEAEGLFDEAVKRPMPAFPRRVGIVTSPTGAALFDILHVLSRRARSVSVVLIPSRVQGETAGEEIVNAVRTANEMNLTLSPDQRIDVLIVGRGGGSSEDLWAFNEEIVARAIRGSEIPVISAVGHEIDFTIADFAADLRAATPSAAAEIVAQREDDVLAYLASRESDLFQLANYALLKSVNKFQTAAMSPVFATFPASVTDRSAAISVLAERGERAFTSRVEALDQKLRSIISQLSPLSLASKVGAANTSLAVLQQRSVAASEALLNGKLKSLKICMAKLDALSPLSVLKRGFSITETSYGEIVRRSEQVAVDDELDVRLGEGRLKTKVLLVD